MKCLIFEEVNGESKLDFSKFKPVEVSKESVKKWIKKNEKHMVAAKHSIPKLLCAHLSISLCVGFCSDSVKIDQDDQVLLIRVETREKNKNYDLKDLLMGEIKFFSINFN